MTEITFAPLCEADLPLLGGWMLLPHWREWWGEPDAELSGLADMLAGRDSTRPFLFHAGGKPAGYIQVWRIADALVEPELTEAPWLQSLPREAVGVDLSIGPADLLGRGIGSATLSAFVARLHAGGNREIIIDPDPANRRAVRAFQKAGFRPIPGLACHPGVLPMRHVG